MADGGTTTRVRDLVNTATEAARSATSEQSEDDFTSDVVANTFRSFRRRRVTESTHRSGKRGRKASLEWKVSVFLLRRSSHDYFPAKSESNFLQENLFGTPQGGQKHFLVNRNWTIIQLKTKLADLYPTKPLGLIGFSFAKCGKGRKIIHLQANSIRDLEKAVGKGRLILVPNSDLPVRETQPGTPGTPTVAFNNRASALHQSTDGQSRSSSLTALDHVPAVSSRPNSLPPLDDLPAVTFDLGDDILDQHQQQLPAPVIPLYEIESDSEGPDAVDHDLTPHKDVKNCPEATRTKIHEEVNTAFMALKELVGEERKIDVQRAHVFKTLMQMYHEDEDLVNHSLNVSFTGESGVDLGGLTKELFTLFWVEANKELFAGEHYSVPCMPLHRQRKEMWKFPVLGRVLAHTAALLGSLPGRIAPSAIIAIVFDSNIESESLLHDFLLYVSPVERRLLQKAMSSFDHLTKAEQDNLITFFSLNQLQQLPSKADIKDQVIAIAQESLLRKPQRFYELMRQAIPEAHLNVFWGQLTIPHVIHILESQRPSANKVLTKIKTEFDGDDERPLLPEEERVVYYLSQFISLMDHDELLQFLLFVTGSIHFPEDPITISFVNTVGLLRRPVAHTCSNTLELSTNFHTFNEFKRIFRAYLADPYTYEFTVM